MKLFTKYTIASFALVLFFSAFGIVEANGQGGGALNDVYKRMEDHRKALTSLKTGLKMVKYNPQLDESETLLGSATYLPAKGRDALIRVDWTKPRKETLSVVNKQYVVYTPDLKQAITGKASDAKGSGKANSLFTFLSMSKDELKSNYEVKYYGEEKVSGTIPTWHLELTPKGASPFASADLWIDGNGMPIQMKITEKSKDTVTVLLSGMQKNQTINAKVFKVDIPKGTKMISG